MKNWIISNTRYKPTFPLMTLCGLMIFSLFVFNSSSVLADVSQYTARKLVSAGQILPLAQIHEKAYLIKAGKIIETELENKKDRFIYEVELIDDKGLVWEMKLDAKTGQLIKLEQD